MRDFIDRMSAIETLRAEVVEDLQFGDELTAGYNDGLNMAITIMSMLPSAERKTGRWVPEYPVTSICSECRYLIHDSKVKVFAFCPNCGADMRGDKE